MILRLSEALEVCEGKSVKNAVICLQISAGLASFVASFDNCCPRLHNIEGWDNITAIN